MTWRARCTSLTRTPWSSTSSPLTTTALECTSTLRPRAGTRSSGPRTGSTCLTHQVGCSVLDIAQSLWLVSFWGKILQLWYLPEHWLSSFVLFSERLYQTPPSVYQKDDVVDSGTEGEPIEKLYKGDGQLIIDLKQVKTFSFWQEKPFQES